MKRLGFDLPCPSDEEIRLTDEVNARRPRRPLRPRPLSLFTWKYEAERRRRNALARERRRLREAKGPEHATSMRQVREAAEDAGVDLQL